MRILNYPKLTRQDLAQLLSKTLVGALLVVIFPASAQGQEVEVSRFIPSESMSMHDLFFESMRYGLYERPAVGDAPMKGPVFDAYQSEQEKTSFPCLKEKLYDKDPEYWSRFYRGVLAVYRFQYAMQRQATDAERAKVIETIFNYDYYDLEERQLQLAKTIEMPKLQLRVGTACD
jgi:hypothetical protein